jgi:hypothetical protein
MGDKTRRAVFMPAFGGHAPTLLIERFVAYDAIICERGGSEKSGWDIRGTFDIGHKDDFLC